MKHIILIQVHIELMLRIFKIIKGQNALFFLISEEARNEIN